METRDDTLRVGDGAALIEERTPRAEEEPPRVEEGAPEALETRALPMTLITPMSRLRARINRMVGSTNMWLLRRGLRLYPWNRLTRLSFIHFAHWSIVYRMPPNDPKGRRLKTPYQLFQTNFNRGWREYVEGFCYVLPLGVRLNWSGKWTGGYGFPKPKPVGPFLDYVDERFTKAAHFYCAYPNDSTRTVLSALDERQRFHKFAAANHQPPGKFAHRHRRLRPPRARALGEGLLQEPRETISVMCPILEGHHGILQDLFCALNRSDEQSPLARVTNTHMARWSLVEPLPYKNKGRPIDDVWYLLFTSWYGGHTSAYIQALQLALGDLADDIWSNCIGYPGRRDIAEFERYLIRHRIKPHMTFGGYPDSVTEVRASLQLGRNLKHTVTKQAGLGNTTLEKAWRKDNRWRLPRARRRR